MVQYGLFFKIDGKWVRIGPAALPKANAIVVFQNALLTWMSFGASLRPVKPGQKQASLIVRPAYGRDYTSNDEAIKDWDENKDFVCHWPQSGGTYCNKRDLQSYGNGHAVILFDHQSKIVFV